MTHVHVRAPDYFSCASLLELSPMCDLSVGGMTCMRCFCSCIWGTPDPGPVRLKDVQQQVVLDTNRMGENWIRHMNSGHVRVRGRVAPL